MLIEREADKLAGGHFALQFALHCQQRQPRERWSVLVSFTKHFV